jgi:hypothetical protein
VLKQEKVTLRVNPEPSVLAESRRIDFNFTNWYTLLKKEAMD